MAYGGGVFRCHFQCRRIQPSVLLGCNLSGLRQVARRGIFQAGQVQLLIGPALKYIGLAQLQHQALSNGLLGGLLE